MSLRYGHEFKTQFEYLSQSSDCRPGNPWIVFSEYFLNSFWKQFSHYFPWHPNTTSQPPRIICLWRSSGQTLDIYCNGKAWNISHFSLFFSIFQQLPPALTNQQSSPVSSFPVDVLNSNSTPTIVTDSNGNQFLLTMPNQNTEAPARGRRSQGKVTNQNKLVPQCLEMSKSI